MPEPVAVNSWVLALVALVITAGGLVWIPILIRCIRHEPIFKFEPRPSVPWGAGASLLAVMMVLMAVWNVMSGVEQPNLDEISPLEMAKQIAGSGLLTLLITTVAVTLIGVTSGASWRDFGLPGKVPELIRDVKFGGLAWLATLIPVYGVQALLIYLLGQPSAHPLLKILLQEPTPVLIVAGFLMAVIVAPICEELAFRLLLQSCLEKWETARVTANSMSLDTDISSGPEEASDATVSRATRSGPDELVYSQPAFLLTTKPTRGVGGLPYGWVPIAVSSFLFALAHLGHGPDPIAIFFLAIILGYTYQQTHRVIPCIITHMLFNALSLGMLLMQILHEPGGGMIHVQGHSRGAVLPIRVHAGGSHNRVVGVHDGMLRISVTAAPEKGKANKAVVDLLSQVFCVPKSSVQLIAGATSPRKRFLFHDLEPAELQDRCTRLIESN